MTRRGLATVILSIAVLSAAAWQLLTQKRGSNAVIVYVSHDQVFSEPVLKDFERDTGIKVKAVYDTEETKSAGVVNRLIAEKANPQADVYWANEPIRAELLRQQGITAAYRSPSAEGIAQQFRDPSGHWTGFSARVRVLIVDASLKEKPTSIRAYTDPRFMGKGVIANPLFGTTTAHMAALFTVMGDAPAKSFMQEMRMQGVHVASSNGDSAEQVANGSFQFSLVDSDDVFARKKQGQAVEAVYPDQEEGGLGCFVVPNAVLLIEHAPHPEAGRTLIDYLLSRETEKKLAFSDAAQFPLHLGVDTPPGMRALETLKAMKVDYAVVAAKMQAIQPVLRDWVGH